MRAVLRFVGRLLFVTLLLSSAVLKIKQPTSYTADITQGYDSIRSLHSSLPDILPSSTTVNANMPIPTLVRVIGAVEGLIALLIVFGDRLGGVLLCAYLLVFGVAHYGKTLVSAIGTQKFDSLISLLPNLTLLATLLGFSFVFMHGHAPRKSAFKA